MKIIKHTLFILALFSTSTFATTPTNYAAIPTFELQIQVERLSLQGELPFEMGLELMRRWTTI